MSANPNPVESTALNALSEQQKDALLGEILGDVIRLHRSVKDLSQIVVDTDERISARMVELRQISIELGAQREAAFAAISVRAREHAQQAFREDVADSFRRFETVLSEVPRAIAAAAHRRFSEMVTVGIAAGALSCIGTLIGIWMMRH